MSDTYQSFIRNAAADILAEFRRQLPESGVLTPVQADPFFSIRESVEYLRNTHQTGIAPKTLRLACKSGDLPHIGGKEIKIRKSSLDTWGTRSS